MSELRTEPRLQDPDAFMEAINRLHRDRSAEESRLINARLILLLANHIGDPEVLDRAMRLAGDLPNDVSRPATRFPRPGT